MAQSKLDRRLCRIRIFKKIVKSYIWDAMNEEEKEQGDNKLRDLDGNEIKNDNVPQKGVQ